MNEALVFFPYKPPYEALYSEVIEPCLRDCKLAPIRADQSSGSLPVLDKLEALMRGCKLIIIEAATASAAVHFEFGLAYASGKELVLLAEERAELPLYTRHFQVLRYSHERYADLREDLTKWIMNTRVSKDIAARDHVRIMRRGEIIQDLVDATFFLQTKMTDEVDLIRTSIRSGALIPSKFFYLSDLGALRWLSLCNDPSYDIFYHSANYIEEHKNAILAACGDDFIQTSPDYVSLGPGNGYKDRSLMEALLQMVKQGSELFYYPVDVSLMMLSRATQTMATDKDIKAALKIKALCADFKYLSSLLPVYDFRPEPNLYLLLGNTLGNMSNEGEFLHQLIDRVMSTEDRAIIEVRLQSDRMDNPGGSPELRKRFNFTPLETVGVRFEPDKLTFRRDQRLSVIPETETLVGEYSNYLYDGSVIRRTPLTYIHHYRAEQVRKTLEKLGFTILGQFGTDRIAIFVLCKKP